MEVKDGDETGNESGLSRPTWLTLSLASEFNTKYRHAIATGGHATEREAYDCNYLGSGKYSWMIMIKEAEFRWALRRHSRRQALTINHMRLPVLPWSLTFCILHYLLDVRLCTTVDQTDTQQT